MVQKITELPVIDLAYILFQEADTSESENFQSFIKKSLWLSSLFNEIAFASQIQFERVGPTEKTIYDRVFKEKYSNLAEKIGKRDFRGNLALSELEIYQFTLIEPSESDYFFREISKKTSSFLSLFSSMPKSSCGNILDTLFYKFNNREDVVYACHNYKSLGNMKEIFFADTNSYIE